MNFTVKEPFGVVAAIVPFNYPLLLMAWKVAPALAAGNTVVIKPAEETPLATLKLAHAFEVLPPGVVAIVTGTGEEAGEALVASPARRHDRVHRLDRDRQAHHAASPPTRSRR